MRKNTIFSLVIFITIGFVSCVSKGGNDTSQSNENNSEQIPQPTTDELPSWLKGHWGIKKQIDFNFEYVVEAYFHKDGTLDFVMAGLPQQRCKFEIPHGSNMIIFDYHGQTIELYYNESGRRLQTPTGESFYKE